MNKKSSESSRSSEALTPWEGPKFEKFLEDSEGQIERMVEEHFQRIPNRIKQLQALKLSKEKLIELLAHAQDRIEYLENFFDLTVEHSKRVATEDAIRQRAREAAIAKQARDPKMEEMKTVFEHWKQWQMGKENYSGKAEFARAMVKRSTYLKSARNIEDKCRKWEKEAQPAGRLRQSASRPRSLLL